MNPVYFVAAGGHASGPSSNSNATVFLSQMFKQHKQQGNVVTCLSFKNTF